MRFKLDENFATRTQRLFRDAGHDAATVREEELPGASDRSIYDMCCEEHRCLVTLDLDFANAGQFPPEQSGGVVVIRVPRNPSLALLELLVKQLLAALSGLQVEQQLWIVEVGRTRIRQRDNWS